MVAAPTAQALALAAGLIRAGRLVGMPTETVYGLAANALDVAACTSIFAVKRRPADNPLIVHVLDAAQASALGDLGPLGQRLAEAFWPGPITLVVRSRQGGGTIALRAPAHPVARQLIALSERPLAAPSANLSGRPSPTTAQHVAAELAGLVGLILDGGPTTVGLESTVVDLSAKVPVILRPGAISPEALAAYGVLATAAGDSHAPSPGTRYRHYRPAIPVVVLVDGPNQSAAQVIDEWALVLAQAGEVPALVWVGDRRPTKWPGRCFASSAAMATGLFAAMRELETKATVLVVAAPPAEGIGHAIRDRLWRAAGGVFRIAGQLPSVDLGKGD